MEPALCQLYRHTFVPCVHPYCDLMKLLLSWMQDLVAQTRSTVRVTVTMAALTEWRWPKTILTLKQLRVFKS